MTMVVMTVLIDDPAEYQIMICLMTVLFRMDDPQHDHPDKDQEAGDEINDGATCRSLSSSTS
ncbi:MAG: hypothetical protein ACKPGL_00040 [Dolichospermum sp.]